ncbi:hypothetical protein ABG768_006213 [Culter alburnus]|uniref:RRM domain-containing protein n=1 Tax=Culter alburnus TaxID=194366 RepID=A0AAW1ZR94_CULAL
MAGSYDWFSPEDDVQQRDQGSSLLVNNLHQDVTERLLHTIFHPFGHIVSVYVCRNAVTGRSRGYGFVTFEHRHDAENALEALNYLELMDLPMMCSWAHYMDIKVLARHSDRFSIYNTLSNYAEVLEPRESINEATRSLLVSNLKSNVTEQELRAMFLPFGPICTVQVCRDRRTNLSRGYGFVTFKHRCDAEDAIVALNFSELSGQPVHIHWGQDSTIKVLARGKESSSRYWHVEEKAQTEPIEQSWGRRLANSVKSFFTTVLTNPEAVIGIGLLACGLFMRRG